jgi:hypothetical protein
MRTVLAAALAAAALASTASARPTANPTLIGKVGLHDAYTITLTFTSGRKVKTLPAGTYTLIVHDYSKIHNFALGSQTQNKRLLTTGIPWVGTRKYRLRLVPGSYAFACSAHFQTMNGTFLVTARA